MIARRLVQCTRNDGVIVSSRRVESQRFSFWGHRLQRLRPRSFCRLSRFVTREGGIVERTLYGIPQICVSLLSPFLASSVRGAGSSQYFHFLFVSYSRIFFFSIFIGPEGQYLFSFSASTSQLLSKLLLSLLSLERPQDLCSSRMSGSSSA